MNDTITRSHHGPDIWCEDLVRIHTTEGVEVQALQGLSLTVDPGEVVAVVGASGSGKSTLLNILSGLDRPTGGRARVAGHDLTAMGRRQRIDFRRHSVGFVFQQTSRNLLPFLTGAENVTMPMVIAGRSQRRGRALQLLELLGVADCANRVPRQLSGGQQQRVAIATALANSPDVLLADEPTGELDEVNSAEVLDLMRAAATELGTTVLIVTHDPMVSDHVARTVQIRDGRTSTEVLRRTEIGPDGVAREVAEEYTVIDRSGRLQLPPAHVEELGLHDRVRITRETGHVGVWPNGSRARRSAPEEDA
ncbi:ABC transporter ATP-binding protein [Tessaracoccus sp. MC1865]|uniref:ABC transporter ATP-binding protein n=1 Tax=Tessaracoccus sp. MC1865 TaxID=2760310 RepID=UPI0015FF4C97|nr:ABC transporter ATP-binding protein [Tessaracoccus sp. MC1865]MBB1483869.1 ABC transporter ATP-binding protein [Tessaracoccus sp. MC1865]QTO36924.1 ABC transporter ATP-binding protein [Tessaracoccus sp. MC1865]